MTKSELINAVNSAADAKGIVLTKKDTGEVIDILFDTIAAAIQETERFSYPNFGTFSVKHRKAREGRNPRTGSPIKIESSKSVSFKPAPNLRDRVN
ncbi:MAG: HU family DNA-binding protein [Bradymonadaceae bacterium]|nr:HU family DNA-binding protein [Lujinxingiaceae bacterium]